MTITKKLLQAASGNAGGDNLYVEDVFSTFLYTGNDTDRDIVNGIDLADNGGLVWIKSRQAAEGHRLIDSEWSLAANQYIDSSSATAPFSGPVINAFNANGFELDANWYGNSSDTQYGGDFASWTFRKAEKFFDVVTWTGNATAGRQISHSLGSTPGFIITKRTDGADNWKCYHVGNPSPAEDYVIELDNTNAAGNEGIWNDTAPTATNFTVSAGGAINGNGMTYVAYLFASDAGGYGDDEDENIIKCGSYTGNGNATGPLINLGFEPQFVLIKAASRTGHWFLLDVMRGIQTGPSSSSPGTNQYLLANTSGAEGATTSINVNSTGFQPRTTDDSVNENSATYIYVAIRRPMKTPESGTEVFALKNPGYPVDSNGLAFTSGFPVDFALSKEVSATDGWLAMSRLQGNGNRLRTNTTEAEAGGISYGTFDHNTGWYSTASANMSWMFKRAPGFFDMAAYTGNGSGSGQVLQHNLGVTPEIIIIKGRSNSGRQWHTYVASQGQDKALFIESNGAEQANTALVGGTINSTQYELKVDFANVNGNGETYISYLFASLAGVSKVGSYTGTAADLNVDCGFSAGARFVMIKRTDASGDWFIWDSVRGIVSGDDPYVRWNVSSAEVTNTDYIDPLSSGFTVTSSASSTVNVSSGSYIFLAIA